MKNIVIAVLGILALMMGYFVFLQKTGDTVESESGFLEQTTPESIGLKTQSGQVVKQKVPVVLYSSDSCPYCLQAKAFLKKKGVEYQVRDTSIGKNAEEMVTRTGRRGIPQIFINRQHIGGYSELLALDQSGDLDSMLQGIAPQ